MADRTPAAPEIVCDPCSDGGVVLVCVECGPLLGGRKYLHGAALYEDLKWHRRAHVWGVVETNGGDWE